jgi:hypothetical protein
MPRLTNKRLHELTQTYGVAYESYRSCARAIARLKKNGEAVSPALLLREERALRKLTRARSRLLAEMAVLSKTP